MRLRDIHGFDERFKKIKELPSELKNDSLEVLLTDLKAYSVQDKFIKDLILKVETERR